MTDIPDDEGTPPVADGEPAVNALLLALTGAAPASIPDDVRYLLWLYVLCKSGVITGDEFANRKRLVLAREPQFPTATQTPTQCVTQAHDPPTPCCKPCDKTVTGS